MGLLRGSKIRTRWVEKFSCFYDGRNGNISPLKFIRTGLDKALLR
jgi:hypothetical protein